MEILFDEYDVKSAEARSADSNAVYKIINITHPSARNSKKMIELELETVLRTRGTYNR